MVVEQVYAIDATVKQRTPEAGTTETMADRSPPDRLNIASFKHPHRRLTGATRGADPEHRGGAGYKTWLAGAPAAAASRPGGLALRKRRPRPAPVAARGAAVRDGDRGICMPGVFYAGSDSRSFTESLGSGPPDEQRPLLRRRAGGLPTREAVHVATTGFVEGDGRGAATAADPEGGRRASSYVGDGAREVATACTCVMYV